MPVYGVQSKQNGHNNVLPPAVSIAALYPTIRVMGNEREYLKIRRLVMHHLWVKKGAEPLW